MPLLWGQDPTRQRVDQACWVEAVSVSPLGKRDSDSPTMVITAR